MTIDELKCNALEVWQDTGITLNEMLDIVIDDFESRTCENCKHGEETDDGGYDIYCKKLSDYMYDIQLCKKWESK